MGFLRVSAPREAEWGAAPCVGGAQVPCRFALRCVEMAGLSEMYNCSDGWEGGLTDVKQVEHDGGRQAHRLSHSEPWKYIATLSYLIVHLLDVLSSHL
jgi:hypothetical protein